MSHDLFGKAVPTLPDHALVMMAMVDVGIMRMTVQERRVHVNMHMPLATRICR